MRSPGTVLLITGAKCEVKPSTEASGPRIWWHCIDHTTTSILLPIVTLGPKREILLLASGEKLILPWLHSGKRTIESRQKTHCTQSEEKYLTIVPTVLKNPLLRDAICVKHFPIVLAGVKHIYVHINTHTHTHIYIYINILWDEHWAITDRI